MKIQTEHLVIGAGLTGWAAATALAGLKLDAIVLSLKGPPRWRAGRPPGFFYWHREVPGSLPIDFDFKIHETPVGVDVAGLYQSKVYGLRPGREPSLTALDKMKRGWYCPTGLVEPNIRIEHATEIRSIMVYSLDGPLLVQTNTLDIEAKHVWWTIDLRKLIKIWRRDWAPVPDCLQAIGIQVVRQGGPVRPMASGSRQLVTYCPARCHAWYRAVYWSDGISDFEYPASYKGGHRWPPKEHEYKLVPNAKLLVRTEDAAQRLSEYTRFAAEFNLHLAGRLGRWDPLSLSTDVMDQIERLSGAERRPADSM